MFGSTASREARFGRTVMAGASRQPMPNDDATKTPTRGHQLFYDIVQSASDPNRQWMLIGKDASGTEYFRVGFKRYGDAWRAAERRKLDAEESQADLQAWIA